VKKTIIVIVGICCIALGLLANNLLNSSKQPSVNQLKAQILDKGNYRQFVPSKNINPFALQSVDGDFTNKDLMGKWTFVVFGYTYCPDVCPTTLTRAKGVLKSLQATADVQVAFVSADPLRDTPERLSQYVNYFDASFLGVTTTHDKLFPFAQNLYLPYGIVAVKKSEDYAVNHSASIALINPQGEYIVQFKPQHITGEVPTVDMKEMAESFKNIVKNSQ
jgi:protein SCO1/2